MQVFSHVAQAAPFSASPVRVGCKENCENDEVCFSLLSLLLLVLSSSPEALSSPRPFQNQLSGSGMAIVQW